MPEFEAIPEDADRAFTRNLSLLIEELAEGEERLSALLHASFGRLALKECGRAVAFETLDDCSHRYGSEFRGHLRDWLKSAIVNEAPWLANVNERGVPKKLAKLGSLASLRKEIDKQMARASSRLRSSDVGMGDERVEMELDSGWNVVRLLTTKALVRESIEMQHCVGHGSYDNRLLMGTHRYMSLRDPANKPHATLEVECSDHGNECVLVQLRGKQNREPLGKYMVRLVEYLERSGIILTDRQYGLICDRRGKIHNIEALPEVLEIDHPLVVRSTDQNIKLPRVIRGAAVTFIGDFPEMPQEITATESLMLNGEIALPSRLFVAGTMTIANSSIACLPDDLTVGHLVLVATPNLSLPKGLVVDGMLNLSQSQMGITEIPADTRFREIDISNRRIKVLDTVGFLPPRQDSDPAPTLIARNGQLEEIKGKRTFSRLEVAGSTWKSLPSDLVVTHLLDISNTDVSTIPERAVPEIMLVATECRDLTLPSDLDCERVDLTGATVRLPETITCVGEIVLQRAKIITMATVMKAERISLESAQFDALPSVIEADVILARDAGIRTLPSGLKASSVYISSGPLSIEPGARLANLNVTIKWGAYRHGQVQDLTLKAAKKAISETGGVGLGGEKSAPFLVFEQDEFWGVIDRYPALVAKRESRKTGVPAFTGGSIMASVRSLFTRSREYRLAC